MLRLYVLQNLYAPSDEGTVAEVLDSCAFSNFCGVDSSNQLPDGDMLGRFQNLVIRNGILEKLFTQVTMLLEERGLLLKKTIVDLSRISTPSSTQNAEKWVPEAHSAKEGNNWHFAIKRTLAWTRTASTTERRDTEVCKKVCGSEILVESIFFLVERA